ncbi:unnamed protein product [Symbiodinium sp. CCMP2456]|nr:unnamed protein product [Symbiodinium sp. CCMP2456]
MGLAGELIWFTKQISAAGWQSAWTRSSQLLLGTQQVALQPDVVLLGAVSGAFSHGRRWQEAVQLVAGLQCLAVRANQVLHGAIVAACREQWLRAFCVLQEMSEVNLGASTVAAGPVVHASPWVLGLDLLGDLRGRLCEISSVCWNSIIASSGASWPKALNLLDVSKQDAAETNLVALTAAFIVTSAWRASTGLTEQWDAPAYGAAFTKLGAFGEWARPLALLQQASEGRVHLEQPQSAAAVGACSRSSAWRRSLNILLRRSHSYARPVDNVAAWTSSADASGQMQYWQNALQVLRVARSSGVKLDATAAVTAERACLAAEEWIRSLEILAGQRHVRLSGDIVSHAVSVEACCVGSCWNQALVLVVSQRDQTSSAALNSFVSSCTSAGAWQQAVEALSFVPSTETEEDAVFGWNSALMACVSADKWDKALLLLNDMSAVLLKPDVVSLATVLDTLQSKTHQVRLLDSLSAVSVTCSESRHLLLAAQELEAHGMLASTVAAAAFGAARRSFRSVLGLRCKGGSQRVAEVPDLSQDRRFAIDVEEPPPYDENPMKVRSVVWWPEERRKYLDELRPTRHPSTNGVCQHSCPGPRLAGECSQDPGMGVGLALGYTSPRRRGSMESRTTAGMAASTCR